MKLTAGLSDEVYERTCDDTFGNGRWRESYVDGAWRRVAPGAGAGPGQGARKPRPGDTECALELWTPGRWVDANWVDGTWRRCKGAVVFANKAGRRLCDDCVRWAEREGRAIPGGALRRADQPPDAVLQAPVPKRFHARAARAAAEQQIPLNQFVRAAVVHAVHRHEAEAGKNGE